MEKLPLKTLVRYRGDNISMSKEIGEVQETKGSFCLVKFKNDKIGAGVVDASNLEAMNPSLPSDIPSPI